MSYDYATAVETFATARRQLYSLRQQQQQATAESAAAATMAMETISQLSLHCPLTPLLWIHYASTMADIISTNNKMNENDNTDDNDDATTLSSSQQHQHTQPQQQRNYEMELQTLQLGLIEFPGSALLQVRMIVVQMYHSLLPSLLLLQQQAQQQSQLDEMHDELLESISTNVTTIRETLTTLGNVVYRNEDYLVVVLYRLWSVLSMVGMMTTIVTSQKDDNHEDQLENTNSLSSSSYRSIQYWQAQYSASWIARSKCPMRTMNETLSAEQSKLDAQFRQLSEWDDNNVTETSTLTQQLRDDMDHGRRYEAQHYAIFIPYETDIDNAIQQETGVLARQQSEFQKQQRQEEESPQNDAPTHIHDTTAEKPNPPSLLSKKSTLSSSLGNMITSCWDHIDWDVILQSNNQSYGMGLGGDNTARAFVRYVRMVQQQQKQQGMTTTSPKSPHLDNEEDDDNDDEMTAGDTLHHDDDDDVQRQQRQMVMAIYERGIAECPCIEYLWMCYLRDLQRYSTGSAKYPRYDVEATSRLVSVAARAVRNCPYSVPLLKLQLSVVLQLASLKVESTSSSSSSSSATAAAVLRHKTVIDPDQLLELVQKGMDLQFLPKDPYVALDLYLTAICTVKRRILSIVASWLPPPPHDDQHVKKNPKNKKNNKQLPSALYYDDGEPLHPAKTKKNGKKAANVDDSIDNVDEEAVQEVQDLLDDVSDMYEEVERRLRKASFAESIPWLYVDRARTESLLLTPLRHALSEENPTPLVSTTTTADSSQEEQEDDRRIVDIMSHYEKSIRVHNPPHPDIYVNYIRQYQSAIGSSVAAPSATRVMIRLRQIRGLFEKAIVSVGRGKDHNNNSTTAVMQSPSMNGGVRLYYCRDYETALHDLCNEWIEFERIFGSERSLGKAMKAIDKKRQKLIVAGATTTRSRHRRPSNALQQQQPSSDPTATTVEPSVPPAPLMTSNGNVTTKRSSVDMDNEETNRDNNTPRPTKRVKVASDVSDEPETTNEGAHAVVGVAHMVSKRKKVMPKILVGKLEYPAHPLTVRVSNLSLDTEDMDLVDTFRPKCGAIVHAKIIREHHQHQHGKGVSKGWGLIQFESEESVEAALALDDTIGIHEKVVKIDRSHIPAVSIVPPGMHRVRPMGEGKVSKRNQKHREQKTSSSDNSTRPTSMDETAVAESDNKPQETTTNPTSLSKKPTTTANLFRPRAVGRGSNKPKPKLNV